MFCAHYARWLVLHTLNSMTFLHTIHEMTCFVRIMQRDWFYAHYLDSDLGSDSHSDSGSVSNLGSDSGSYLDSD